MAIEARRAVGMLLLAVLAAYANSFAGVFQYDDFGVIVDNPQVQSWAAFSADFGRGIRPLLRFVDWLCWAAGSGREWPFHVFNLAVHLGNALLVRHLGLALFARCGVAFEQAAPAALIAALIFALHPVQTEAVTYICGQSSSLMALFTLLCLAAWARWREHGGLWWWLASFAAFIAALASKETALTLPVLLMLWDALPAPRRSARLTPLLPFFAVLLAALFVAVPHTRYERFFVVSLSERPLWHNAMTQIAGLNWLLGELLLWRRPNIDPDLAVVTVASPLLLMQAAVLMALLAIALRLGRQHRWAAFCAAFGVLHFLPTNSLLPRLDVANDRQWVLPLVAVSWSLGFALAALRRRHARWMTPAIASLLLVLAASTVQRNRDYADPIRLWGEATKLSPNKARVWNNYGAALADAGREIEARAALRRALQIDPDFAEARENLGLPPRHVRIRPPNP